MSSIPTNRAILASPRGRRTPEPVSPAGYHAVGDCCGGGGPTNEIDEKGCFGSDIAMVARETWAAQAIADQNASRAPASVAHLPKVISIEA